MITVEERLEGDKVAKEIRDTIENLNKLLFKAHTLNLYVSITTSLDSNTRTFQLEALQRTETL